MVCPQTLLSSFFKRREGSLLVINKMNPNNAGSSERVSTPRCENYRKILLHVEFKQIDISIKVIDLEKSLTI